MHGMQVPAHITGWMSNSLATSSLLKAVGVGGGSAEGAAAAAAAIKWITKDGIGAAGPVLVRHHASQDLQLPAQRTACGLHFVCLGLRQLWLKSSMGGVPSWHGRPLPLSRKQ